MSAEQSADVSFPPMRGLWTRRSDLKEVFQSSLFRAFVSAAGCNLWEASIDEGIDFTVTHVHPSTSQRASIYFQLKAVGRGLNRERTRISAQMTKLRYKEFIVPQPSCPQIVVIMDLPANQEEWISARGRKNIVARNRCYWVNLEGLPDVEDDGGKITVTAPVRNVFDDVALCQMMADIHSGKRP